MFAKTLKASCLSFLVKTSYRSLSYFSIYEDKILIVGKNTSSRSVHLRLRPYKLMEPEQLTCDFIRILTVLGPIMLKFTVWIIFFLITYFPVDNLKRIYSNKGFCAWSKRWAIGMSFEKYLLLFHLPSIKLTLTL